MNKKIKVLECIRQGQIGGGESHLLSLVENMDRNRFDPVVLSFTDGPMIDRLKRMNVPCHIIPTLKPFDISKWKQVKNFMKQEQFDIVHAHGTRANSNVLWASRSLNVPVVYTIHGWSFHQDQNPIVRNIRTWGEAYLTSRSDCNISVSKSNQESGKAVIKSFDSVVINNGIDQKRFNPAGEFKDIRKELSIPETDILILFIARFTSHKQPLTLIKAFSAIAAAHPSLKLLLVGEGDQKAEALELVAKSGLQNSILFQPFRSDVPDVLAAADIFVLPSLWEGLPIGLLEAMSMGKAVIASNVDGSREVVKNEVNGLLIETDKLIENLSAALLQLSNNKEKRMQLGAGAIATVREDFNALTMTRQIEKIYSDLVNKASKK